MLCYAAMLQGGLFLLLVATMTAAQQRRQEANGRWSHRIQHGQCSYTFVLPEPRPCLQEPETFGGSNILQRDSAASALHLGDWRAQRVQRLERALENNTRWLRKVGGPVERVAGGIGDGVGWGWVANIEVG